MERSKMGLLLYLFLVQVHIAAAKDFACGFPGAPAYGSVKPDVAAYSAGEHVAYSCRIGYILLGSPINRCNPDGSWTEEVPICDESMTTLGTATSTPTFPNHIADLAIDRDKDTCTYLKPKKPRWWRIDLGLEHKVLSVAITMFSPDKYFKFTVFVIKVRDSSAAYTRCASFSGKFGTQTVVLSCKEGKGIEGQRVHIEDHQPLEGSFEICEVEVQVEKDTGHDCGRPSRSLYSINYDPVGSVVEYGCLRGYEIKSKDFRTCMSNGQWSGKAPVCKPIICDDLEPLENGRTNLSQTLENGHTRLSEGPPLEGSMAIYECDIGYKLIGSFTRNCTKDGSWSGKTPTCKPIRCPIPEGRPLGGYYKLLNKTNSMGSMAMLRCKKGKREGENPYIICTEDGEWTKTDVHCIIPAAYERKEEPRIVNQGAIIFGMVVAAIMIVVVLVALYLYTQRRRNGDKPQLPSRLIEPPPPPPRPPPRARGTFKTAIMGLINRENSGHEKQDQPMETKNQWKTQSLPSQQAFCNDVDRKHSPKRTLSYDETLPGATTADKPAVIEVEVIAQDDTGKKEINVPDENASLENVVLDIDEKRENKDSSLKDPKSGTDYAAVDYEKKRQSRLLKEQDSMESSSTAGASPLPPDDVDNKEKSLSPTPPKRVSQSEPEEESEASSAAAKVPRTVSPKNVIEEEEASSEEEEDEEDEDEQARENEARRAKEEEEKRAREEDERREKEEAEKKAKEEEEKKEAAASRRRRVRGPPAPPPEEEKPVLRRFRR